MKGKMKGWWQQDRWEWGCGGSERGSSQWKSIAVMMMMLWPVCVSVCVCVFDKQN